MNSSGKVLTIFLVIIAILLITLTAISLFFFQREMDRRKMAESTLEEVRLERVKLEDDLKETKKQNFVLQEKMKEADSRVNDLTDELELEKGLREEMKIEAAALKKEFEEAKSAKDAMVEAIRTKEEVMKTLEEKLSASENKILELEGQLKQEQANGEKLNLLYEKQKKETKSKKEDLEVIKETVVAQEQAADAAEPAVIPEIELEEIVVNSGNVKLADDPAVASEESFDSKEILEGRVLSVDVETEFVVINLGEKDGLVVGQTLSVFQEGVYAGDIEITRLQSEMSAADLIPPFSIRTIHKNDQVKTQ